MSAIIAWKACPSVISSTKKLCMNSCKKKFSTSTHRYGLISTLVGRFSKPSVSVIQLHGIIGKGPKQLNITSTEKFIKAAFKPKKLEAVCLNINSPGGSPVQSELIADRINQLATLKKVPVYSFIEDVGASGGYWLACAGSKIHVSKSSIVGSIGVINSSFGLQDFISRYGIERRLFTAGKSKSLADPFSPLKEEDVERNRRLLEQIHTVFKDHIRECRSGKLKSTEDELFNGEVFIGQHAVDVGLADKAYVLF